MASVPGPLGQELALRERVDQPPHRCLPPGSVQRDAAVPHASRSHHRHARRTFRRTKRGFRTSSRNIPSVATCSKSSRLPPSAGRRAARGRAGGEAATHRTGRAPIPENRTGWMKRWAVAKSAPAKRTRPRTSSSRRRAGSTELRPDEQSGEQERDVFQIVEPRSRERGVVDRRDVPDGQRQRPQDEACFGRETKPSVRRSHVVPVTTRRTRAGSRKRSAGRAGRGRSARAPRRRSIRAAACAPESRYPAGRIERRHERERQHDHAEHVRAEMCPASVVAPASAPQLEECAREEGEAEKRSGDDRRAGIPAREQIAAREHSYRALTRPREPREPLIPQPRRTRACSAYLSIGRNAALLKGMIQLTADQDGTAAGSIPVVRVLSFVGIAAG